VFDNLAQHGRWLAWAVRHGIAQNICGYVRIPTPLARSSAT